MRSNDFERTTEQLYTTPDPSLLFVTKGDDDPKADGADDGADSISSMIEMVPSTTEFDFLADLSPKSRSTLTQDESSLLNCILEWDVRHKIETNWWFVKLHFPSNRRGVLDSVRAIVEQTIAKRKEDDTQNTTERNLDGNNDNRREKEQETLQALVLLRDGSATIAAQKDKDDNLKEQAQMHNADLENALRVQTKKHNEDLAQQVQRHNADLENALRVQTEKHNDDLAQQVQKHNGDLANILKTILALKPVESVVIGSHAEGVAPTIGQEDVVPTVGQALKELVAVIDEHKKVRAILYSRILDQENHLAVVREMVTEKQGEI